MSAFKGRKQRKIRATRPGGNEDQRINPDVAVWPGKNRTQKRAVAKEWHRILVLMTRGTK